MVLSLRCFAQVFLLVFAATLMAFLSCGHASEKGKPSLIIKKGGRMTSSQILVRNLSKTYRVPQ